MDETLTSGTRLGPYEIVELVGRGGMGEVYRARDVRLGRNVAIKVLPSDVAENPVRRARFAREARTISQLSHPHVCAVFDVGEDQSASFLVMEFIDGESLHHLLRKGPIAWNTAVEWAAQIASALDAAHRQGIIHRDLKPANIMVTEAGIKLLDFGLAKLLESSQSTDSMAPSQPAETLTAEQRIVGTLHYMAPEQLEGRAVDERTDVFALGTTLYEMLTGRKAFDAPSAASVSARILTADPAPVSWQDMRRPAAPQALDHVIRRALAKDPDARWQTARDVMHELRWILESPSRNSRAAVPARSSLVRVAALVGTALAGVAVGGFLMRSRPEALAPAAPVVLTITAPPGTQLHQGGWEPAVSPDGRHIAFVAGPEGGVARIWVRSLDTAAARPLLGSDNGSHPFWAPDSRTVGFFVPGERVVKRVPLTGGAPSIVTPYEAGRVTPSAFWDADDTIVFSQSSANLYRVAATGGTPIQVGDGAMPAPLPDGRFLAVALGPNRESRVKIQGAAQGVTTLPVESNAILAAGHLLFRQGTSLFAQPFEARTLQLGGRPRLLAADVRFNPANNRTAFHASAGVLTYRQATPRRLVWRDRSGQAGGSIGEVGRDVNPVVAPDGSGAVAVDRHDPATGVYRVWTIREGGQSRALTDGPRDRFAAWSPDGQWIAHWSAAVAGSELRLTRVDGTQRDVVLASGSQALLPLDWSRDGTFIVCGGGSAPDLWAIRADGSDRTAIQLTNTPGRESTARFSPDGRWIAYTLQEEGRTDVWVQRFPGGQDRRRVSENGGGDPNWRADGQELYYLATDGMLTAVPVRGVLPSFGQPAGLFRISPDAPFVLRSYAAQPDGQRFIVTEPVDTPDAITVVLNWTALLR